MKNEEPAAAILYKPYKLYRNYRFYRNYRLYMTNIRTAAASSSFSY